MYRDAYIQNTDTRIYLCVCIQTHTDAYIFTHTSTNTHTHIHTYTYALKHICIIFLVKKTALGAGGLSVFLLLTAKA